MLTKDYSSSSCLGVDLTILVRNANPTNANEIKKIDAVIKIASLPSRFSSEIYLANPIIEI